MKPANKKKTARIVANVLTGKENNQVFGYNIPEQLIKDLGLPNKGNHMRKFTLTIMGSGPAIIGYEYYVSKDSYKTATNEYEPEIPETIFEDYYLIRIGDHESSKTSK